MRRIFLLSIIFVFFKLNGQIKYAHNNKTHEIEKIEGSMRYNKIIIKDIDTKVIEQSEDRKTEIYFNMDAMDYDKKYIITIYFDGEKKTQKLFYKVAYAYSKIDSPPNVNRDFITFANDINYVANFYTRNSELNEPAKFVLYDKKQRKEIIFSK